LIPGRDYQRVEEGKQSILHERSDDPATLSESRSAVERIVTTLPSATEIVSLLGLEDKLVGISHECNFPPTVRKKQVVVKSALDTQNMTSKEVDGAVLAYSSEGRSIYEVDESLLRRLKPDLIITQELCEVCATPLQIVARSIARLEPKPRIISLSPHDLEDLLKNVLEVGAATGKSAEARRVVSSLQRRIERVKDRCLRNPNIAKPTVFCLEWLDPIYCSGHWMPEIVKYAGGTEIDRKSTRLNSSHPSRSRMPSSA